MRSRYSDNKRQRDNSFSFGYLKKHQPSNHSHFNQFPSTSPIDKRKTLNINIKKEIKTQLQNNIINKEKQNIQEDRIHIKKLQQNNAPLKKFQYNLSQILNEQEINLNSTYKYTKCMNNNQSRYLRSMTQCDKGHSISTMLYRQKNQEQKNDRDRKVEQIKSRNRKVYNESQVKKRNYCPSIDQIKKKYQYKYQNQQSNQDNKHLINNQITRQYQKPQYLKSVYQQTDFLNKQQHINTQLIKKKQQPYNDNIELQDYKERNRRSKIQDLKYTMSLNEQNYMKKQLMLKQKQHQKTFQQQRQLQKQVETRSMYKPKYYKYDKQLQYKNMQENTPSPVLSNNHNLSTNHNMSVSVNIRQRLKTYDGVQENKMKPQLLFNDNNYNNNQNTMNNRNIVQNDMKQQLNQYGQQHRTLQKTADWMKRSICNLDQMINQRLSRIIPSNNKYTQNRYQINK